MNWDNIRQVDDDSSSRRLGAGGMKAPVDGDDDDYGKVDGSSKEGMEGCVVGTHKKNIGVEEGAMTSVTFCVRDLSRLARQERKKNLSEAVR